MSFVQDVRLARRLLVKNPTFTFIVVATLALGIGLTTAVFSAVDALLLRPLPGVKAPEQIVQLYRSWPGDVAYGSNSIPHFTDVRERSSEVFSGVALWSFNPLSVSFNGQPRFVFGTIVSANYFSVLGATPEKGRFFVAREDTGRLANRVAVVSYAAWKGIFGGDESIIGKHTVINGADYEIVGVARKDLTSIIPIVRPAIWVPLTQLTEARPGSETLWEGRGNNSFSVVARVKAGVTLAAVNARMTALIAELRTQHPDDYEGSGITVVPQADAGIHPTMRSAEIGLSAVVMAVVVSLLLIACVNVANLFLARARDRSREMAVRLSLGARRGTLIRQLLVESLMFAAIAALAGLGIALFAITLINRITLPFEVDFSAGLALSPTVLLFTLATSVLAAVAFGIAPAVQATRPSLVPALRGEEPAGQSRSRVRAGLVVAQMALSIVLLVSSGLFLRNLRAITNVDKGFASDNLLLGSIDPGMQGYPRARSEDIYRRLAERLRANPAVRAVGFAQMVPLGLSESDTHVDVPGYTPAKNENMGIQYNVVSDGYFDALGIPILKGRAILARDDSASLPVLVINEEFVHKYFLHRDPIGATVHVSGRDHTVIGVVPTGKYQRLGEPATAFMYFAQSQKFNSGLTVFIRTATDPVALAPMLRAEVSAIDPALPLSEVKSMQRHLGIALLPARLTGGVLGVFGLLGLVLAAIGMYGVTAYSVAQRTREIGIRMAIGATAANVIGMVMRQGLMLVAIGAAIGTAGAYAASRALGSVLYGGGQNDALTFALVPAVLIGVALLATLIPARRAAATDPAVAFRHE